jgi:hypothetical protein
MEFIKARPYSATAILCGLLVAITTGTMVTAWSGTGRLARVKGRLLGDEVIAGEPYSYWESMVNSHSDTNRLPAIRILAKAAVADRTTAHSHAALLLHHSHFSGDVLVALKELLTESLDDGERAEAADLLVKTAGNWLRSEAGVAFVHMAPKSTDEVLACLAVESLGEVGQTLRDLEPTLLFPFLKSPFPRVRACAAHQLAVWRLVGRIDHRAVAELKSALDTEVDVDVKLYLQRGLATLQDGGAYVVDSFESRMYPPVVGPLSRQKIIASRLRANNDVATVHGPGSIRYIGGRR